MIFLLKPSFNTGYILVYWTQNKNMLKSQNRKEGRECMRKQNSQIRLWISVFAVLLIAFAGRADAAQQSEKETEKTVVSENGTLAGIGYDRQVGMVWGEDVSIEIERDRIVEARFFSEEESDYTMIEDVLITEEQWELIEDAVQAILPVLEEKPQTKKTIDLSVQELDGPNTEEFYLIWQSETGEKTKIFYNQPQDRRFQTLLALMEETVNPIGREIIYYDAPVLNGIYAVKEVFLLGRRYSYQLAPAANSEDEWRLIAYYWEKGERKSCQFWVKEDTWKRALERCSELGLEECKEAASANKTFVRLYYSGETCRQVKPDQQTMKELEAFFVELLEELQGK